MEALEFIKRLYDECIRLSVNITFNKKHPRHLYLVALYGTLIELTGCLIALIERKLRTGVRPIFRSILDAYVELSNLHVNPEYAYYMHASYYDQWIKLLKEAKTKPNPYLKKISQSQNLDAEIEDNESDLSKLKSNGYRPLKITERFERAGMINEYRSIYNFLSNDAHSNIRALVSRHVEIHENDFSVVYYKDEPLEDFLPYVNHTAELLIAASLKIHSFFETGAVTEVEKLEAELNEIRSRH